MSRRPTERDVERWTGQKLPPLRRKLSEEIKVTKYRSRRVQFNGLWFDSGKESERAQELILMERAGLITDLILDKRQMHYPLIVNGKKIGTYTPDAQYRERGKLVVEDVKSEATIRMRWYRRAKKLMAALYDIEIKEIMRE
jgi:hypothetical protein